MNRDIGNKQGENVFRSCRYTTDLNLIALIFIVVFVMVSIDLGSSLLFNSASSDVGGYLLYFFKNQQTQ